MRRPAQINHVIEQQESRALFVLLGIEDYESALAVVARPRKFGGNIDRAAELLGSGRDIQRVQALMVIILRVSAHGDEIHGAVRPRRHVDHGRRCNSDLGCHLPAAAIVGRAFVSFQSCDLPERAAVVGVEGIDCSVFADHEHNVVHAAVDGQVRNVERLRVNQSVGGENEELAERAHIHVLERERRLARIPARALVVIVPGEHTFECGRRIGDGFVTENERDESGKKEDCDKQQRGKDSLHMAPQVEASRGFESWILKRRRAQ